MNASTETQEITHEFVRSTQSLFPEKHINYHYGWLPGTELDSLNAYMTYSKKSYGYHHVISMTHGNKEGEKWQLIVKLGRLPIAITEFTDKLEALKAFLECVEQGEG